MKSFTCTNINKNNENKIISYDLQDSTGKSIQISPKKLKMLLESNKISVVNLMLKNNEIIEDPEYQIKSMIVKVKMLGGIEDIAYKSDCGHDYYIIENPDTTLVYIPDDVEYLIDTDNDAFDDPDFSHIECNTLKVIGGSGLTSTCYMFYECKAQSLDFSSFDTSNVTDMYGMFFGCKAQSLDLSSFDTSKVTNMGVMFMNCKAQSLDLRSFKTSKVKYMHWMFLGCQAQSIDLSSFKTSKVEDMESMFSACKAQSLDLRSFNTSNVENMRWMFKDCEAQSLDLSSFNTSKVICMERMFSACKAQSLDLRSFNTSNVENMDSMFEDCKAQVKTTDSKILDKLSRR